jgi:hypothetical protein
MVVEHGHKGDPASQNDGMARATRQNPLASLLRLPSEILFQIFSLVQNCYKPYVLDQFIHSCSLIYALVISMPSLWTHLDSRWSAQWLFIVVERAKMLPLDIH